MRCRARRSTLILGMALAVGLPRAVPAARAQDVPPPSANVQTFATGLTAPRQLSFGPDGNLYVAEAGPGGTTATTPSQCQQVPSPVGPYTGSATGGAIAKITPGGAVTTVANTFPSTRSANGSTLGVADVAWVDGAMYALLNGAGCSHGVPGVPNGVVRVNPDGTWTLVANLSAFLQANPVQHPDPGDFEPDGTWYSMVQSNGTLYAVEPNHGELDKFDPASGQVTRVADLSGVPWPGPTAIAYYGGDFYVATLSEFPVVPGTADILKVTPEGQVSTAVKGLTAVTGLVIDASGTMYALELSAVPGAPMPGAGTVVRVNADGSLTTIASGLSFPTGMTLGPDGRLYVSTLGYGYPAGIGQVVRITIPTQPATSTPTPTATATALPTSTPIPPPPTPTPVSSTLSVAVTGTVAVHRTSTLHIVVRSVTRPVAGAKVTLQGKRVGLGTRKARTNVHGVATLHKLRPARPGKVSIAVSKRGYRTARITLTVRP